MQVLAAPEHRVRARVLQVLVLQEHVPEVLEKLPVQNRRQAAVKIKQDNTSKIVITRIVIVMDITGADTAAVDTDMADMATAGDGAELGGALAASYGLWHSGDGD
jgi:hypothetical protein